MMKIKKFEHKIILNQFSYLTSDYKYEGNVFSIITRHKVGEDVYKATTNITMDEEEKNVVEEILSEIKPEPISLENSNQVVAIHSNVTFDCSGEEVDVTYINNQKVNNAVEKVMRYLEIKHEDEVMSHEDLIDAILSGETEGIEGVEKEQAKSLF